MLESRLRALPSSRWSRSKLRPDSWSNYPLAIGLVWVRAKINKHLETSVYMRKLLVGACLCAAASGVAALSLGPSRGAVVLGSPIDLMFEVGPDPDKDLASSCLTARLVSGATTISDARVQVTPILGSASPMVRVQARYIADEPVLTVTLAAGCQGRVTRTYTFLVDPPAAASTQAPGSLGLSVPAVAGAPRGMAEGGAAGAETVVRAGARQRSLAARETAGEDSPAAAGEARAFARPAKPVPQAERPRVRAQAAAATPAASTPPRLVVESLDLWLDTPLTLRLTREEPLTLSAPDEAKRAEAAALWKALSATPEDMRQAMARLDKLQADAAAQGKQFEAERAAVAELQQRLTQAQEGSFSASWVYGLAGLLALSLGGMAWLLRRSRREELQAWEHSVALSEALKGDAAVRQAQSPLQPEAVDTWPHSSLPPEEDPTAPMPGDAPDTIPVMPPAAEPEAPAMAPAVEPKAARAQQIVPPEALFDIQQQAEFYVSIGEHEQAIAILRAHIDEHGDAMPWAYLESLRLFHMLGRTEAFNRLREQFRQRFNVQVPEFGQFQQGGHALEDYPEALAQIEALWSSVEVMALLDGFLLRSGQEPESQRFDLAAFDDLLLLLAIAQTTPAHQRGAPPPRARTTPRAARVTLAAAGSPYSVAADLSLMPSGYDVLTPLTQPQAMLDVDLSQLRLPDITLGEHPASAAPAARPTEVDFDLNSDKLELHFELEQMDKKRH